MSDNNWQELRAAIDALSEEFNEEWCKWKVQADEDTRWVVLTDENYDVCMELADDDGAPVHQVRRIALNMDQVEEYQPPPNPAKLTDSRAEDYIDRFGEESWELDALDPSTLNELITDHILSVRDHVLYGEREDRMEREREVLTAMSDHYEELKQFMYDEEMI